jgi:alpha-aminoadipic semialdehyde synthase
VIKGQPYNMPMLKSLMDSGATLIDYEKIENDVGRRLIFFGRYAGLAGMINSLWSTGQRLKQLGFDTPLGELKQSYQYKSLEEAKDAVINAGHTLEKGGMPGELDPFVIAVTGAGNVARGATDILNLLPFQEITAQELKDGNVKSDTGLAAINLTVDEYIEHKHGGDFDLMHYIDHPNEYRSNIESYLPGIDLLVNGLYWDERYPRLVTKKWLQRQHLNHELRLKVIGDITCDIHGSIECTETATPIEEPVFIYNIESDTFQYGFKGEDIAVMAVDILPSELPKESSEHFSSSLMPFLSDIATADFTAPLSELDLPDAVKRALIVYRGELTPNFEYLRAYLP